MESVYKRVLKFQKKFPNTVGWRTKEHCSVVQRHLNPGENIIYAFIAQKKIQHQIYLRRHFQL